MALLETTPIPHDIRTLGQMINPRNYKPPFRISAKAGDGPKRLTSTYFIDYSGVIVNTIYVMFQNNHPLSFNIAVLIFVLLVTALHHGEIVNCTQ